MKIFKDRKGVAGLNIFLTLVTFLFVIGLLVMVYALAGGELQTAQYDPTTETVNNETIATVNNLSTGYSDTAQCGTSKDRNVAITLLQSYRSFGNGSEGELIPNGNFSTSNCRIATANGYIYEGLQHNFTYRFSYDASNVATDVANDTVTSLRDVPKDWFGTFITLGAMVVLVLFVVIIIQAISGTGFFGNNRGV